MHSLISSQLYIKTKGEKLLPFCYALTILLTFTEISCFHSHWLFAYFCKTFLLQKILIFMIENKSIYNLRKDSND